jgi:hypothetical protein
MEFLEVLVRGKTVKDVSVEQIARNLYEVTVGHGSGEEGPDGEWRGYVIGRSQVIIASSMYDACYKAHHLAKLIA